MTVRITVRVEGAEDAAVAVAAIAERFFGAPPADVVREIAEHWASEVFPSLFDRGGDPPWEPLSAVSQKLRGPGRPRAGAGALRASIQILELREDEAVVGTDLGLQHQVGGRTSPASAIPDKVIPIRPFIHLSDVDLDEAEARLERHYFEGLS